MFVHGDLVAQKTLLAQRRVFSGVSPAAFSDVLSNEARITRAYDIAKHALSRLKLQLYRSRLRCVFFSLPSYANFTNNNGNQFPTPFIISSCCVFARTCVNAEFLSRDVNIFFLYSIVK